MATRTLIDTRTKKGTTKPATKKAIVAANAKKKAFAKANTPVKPPVDGTRYTVDDGFINVSQSKAKAWRTCRRQFNYKYIEGLRPLKRKRPLMFGSIVHMMLEADANGDDPFEKLDQIDLTNMKLFREEREMYGEIIEDIRVLMTDYFDYWGPKHPKYISYSRRKGRSAEHEFNIEIAPGVKFKGKIDAVGKSRGMRWVIEHKTFKRMPNEDFRWKAVQSGVYIRAIEINGWWNDLEGTVWDYLGNRPADVPNILLNGKVSEAKLNSLPSRVKAFLATQKATPKDYPKLWSNVLENRDNYYARIYTPLNRAVVDDTWSDFVSTAEEIRDWGPLRKQRTVGQHCSWCDYEKLCRGEVTGLDLDFLKEREYTLEPEDALDGNDEEE